MKKTVKKAAYNKRHVSKKNSANKSKAKSVIKSLNKMYLKSKSMCKVTFKLPKQAAPDAETVTIVGDFNNWNLSEIKMQKLKNGDFKAILELPCNREYRFKYLIDSNRWENDWTADKYTPNEHGSDDSVVVV